VHCEKIEFDLGATLIIINCKLPEFSPRKRDDGIRVYTTI